MIKILVLLFFLLAPPAVLNAEDWCGYVLRRDYWGRDYYWVSDDSKWGKEMETTTPPAKLELKFYEEDVNWFVPSNIGDHAILFGQNEHGLITQVYVYEFKKECEEGVHFIKAKDGCWVLRGTEPVGYFGGKKKCQEE